MIINIYLVYEKIGKKALRSKGMYVLEAINEDGTQVEMYGEPYVIHEIKTFDTTNKNVNEMTMLIEAIDRINKPSIVQIFTDNENIFYTLKNGWNLLWQKNGWKNAKNLIVKNHELWKELTEKLETHSYSVRNDRHSYSIWMNEEIKRKAV